MIINLAAAWTKNQCEDELFLLFDVGEGVMFSLLLCLS